MVIKEFQFIGDVIGQIERKGGIYMNSTNTYLNEEYRCYLLRQNNKTYLTSFACTSSTIKASRVAL